MEFPRLGRLNGPDDLGWLRSRPVLVPLTGRQSEIVLDGYLDDAAREDFHRAVAGFLGLEQTALRFWEKWVFAYYRDIRARVAAANEASVPAIGAASRVWAHVRFGRDVLVSRRARGDRAVYVSLECECDWESRRGLQLVLREGTGVVKIGPYDGHLSNADAFADPRLEHTVYVPG